jgi:hypothetical protein
LLCSEEIRGEVLFVLYKLYVLQSTSHEGDGSDMLIPFCPKLLYLLGDVLLKTQNDDVRLNCIGSLSIFIFSIFLLLSLFWTDSDNMRFYFFPFVYSSR